MFAGVPTQETLLELCREAPMAVLLADGAGNLVWASDRAFQWLEATPEPGEPVEGLLERGLRPVLGEANLFQGADGRWLRQFTARLDGDRYAVYLVDAEGERQAAVDRHELLRTLESQQTRDPLTGLYNRPMLMLLLDGQVSRSRRYGNPLSVMVLEVTEWSAPVEADRVVVAVGQTLRDQLRWVDQIGRLSDRTFLLILPETPEASAFKLADKLRRILAALALDERPLGLTVRTGVSGWHRGDDLRRLLARAEEDLAQSGQAADS